MFVAVLYRGDIHMVDTSKIVPSGSNFLKPELLEALEREAAQKGEQVLLTVIPGSGLEERDFTETTPEGQRVRHVVKPWITVEHNFKVLKWSLTPTANQIIGSQLGFETEHWVGAVLKPFVDVVAGKKTVKAVVVSKPLKK